MLNLTTTLSCNVVALQTVHPTPVKTVEPVGTYQMATSSATVYLRTWEQAVSLVSKSTKHVKCSNTTQVLTSDEWTLCITNGLATLHMQICRHNITINTTNRFTQ